MLKRLAQFVGLAGRALTSSADPRRLRARFDAAATNVENQRHWANADGLAADAACDPAIRGILRNRGRYEQFNNPYMDGQLQTLAADLIGRGPKLRLNTGDDEANTFVEREFARWARVAKCAEKLGTAVESRAAAGECFIVRRKNPKLNHAVKLDLMLLEGDQVAAPTLPLSGDANGIEEDRYGNPAFYWVLRNHPGATNVFQAGAEADRVPASEIIHFFKPRRPGQRRGIPQITSSLPLYAERRGFRQSVLSAARKVAELGAVMVEASGGTSESADQPVPFEELELTGGMMTVLPAGWTGKQMKPEQPGSTFKEFDDKLINEAARPLSMPFNIAACNSSGYNYSSGRLDHQTYDRMLDVDHLKIEIDIMDRVFGWWLEDAKQIPGYLPEAVMMALASTVEFQWLWTGRQHIDPVVEAEAQAKRLANQTATLTDELAREGIDLDTHLTTLRNEREQIARSGIGYQTTIDGPKVASALEVLARIGRSEIAPAAGVELLIAMGIARTWAVPMVAAQPAVAKPTPAAPETSADDEAADPVAARKRLLGLNGNGTANGAHAHG